MLELKVIGCFGSKAKNKDLPAYLLLNREEDRYLALDAGSLCSLSMQEQRKVEKILLTHSHLDHCLDLPMLAYLHFRLKKSSEVYSSQEIIANVERALFTSPVWIPFHELGSINFYPLNPNEETSILDFKVQAIPVEHNQEGLGYLVSRQGVSLFYTGDTGLLEENFWCKLRKISGLKAVIIECTHPNEQEELAKKYHHLCPKMLHKSIERLARTDVKFLATHFLPEQEATIKSQLDALKRKGLNLSWLEQGKIYLFD